MISPKLDPRLTVISLLPLVVPLRRDALVVYSAHDVIYSERILRDSERRNGTPVAVRFDIKATKSLGLVEPWCRRRSCPPKCARCNPPPPRASRSTQKTFAARNACLAWLKSETAQ